MSEPAETTLVGRLTEQIRHEQSWAVLGRESDVRCLDCDLRYAERQEYGCRLGEGYGHSYDDEELAEARAPQQHDVDTLLIDSLAALKAVQSELDAAEDHGALDESNDAWVEVSVIRNALDQP